MKELRIRVTERRLSDELPKGAGSQSSGCSCSCSGGGCGSCGGGACKCGIVVGRKN